ncbi:MAG TPA: ABC transporter substrate-binding protein, partial [Anaerolineae bacterium]|nr:ABC transporter substrate-binding protein [Anaerolineae bacterium]
HDGTPFNAEAVKVSLEREIALKKGAYWVLTALKDVKVIDEYTVQMIIEPGGPPFLEGLTMVFMASPTAIKEHEKGGDRAQDWFSSHVAGTGPYIVKKWIRGDRMVLERFPDYWQGWEGKHFDRVVLLVVPEAGTQQLMLEQGEVDLAENFPLEATEALAQNPDITIYRASGVRVLYLRMNCAAGLTDDVRVRQALAYAFDYEGFRQATAGFFQPSDGPVPSQFMGGWKPEIPYKYDLEKAKALFEEAGVKAGTTIDSYYTAGNPEQRLAAQILQAGLSQLGINLNIIEQEWAPLSKSLAEWGATKDPATAKPMFFLWTPPRIPDAYAYLWYMYHTDASGGRGRNLMYYSNPKVDELID